MFSFKAFIQRKFRLFAKRNDVNASSDALERILSVEGYLGPLEARFLYDTASTLSDGCIVELGSYRGRSTVALALGSQAGNSVPVYAIEPHESFVGEFGATFGPHDRIAFFQNLLRTHCAEIVRVINVKSEEIVPGWAKPVGLLWIDGDHRYESVKQDFELWAPHVVPNGLIALHDTLEQELGPAQVVREALSFPNYQEVCRKESITVLRKLS